MSRLAQPALHQEPTLRLARREIETRSRFVPSSWLRPGRRRSRRPPPERENTSTAAGGSRSGRRRARQFAQAEARIAIGAGAIPASFMQCATNSPHQGTLSALWAIPSTLARSRLPSESRPIVCRACRPARAVQRTAVSHGGAAIAMLFPSIVTGWKSARNLPPSDSSEAGAPSPLPPRLLGQQHEEPGRPVDCAGSEPVDRVTHPLRGCFQSNRKRSPQDAL
jgi:hypothetical protein